MIVTDHQPKRVNVTVFGEFSLADYKEFEELVNPQGEIRGRSTCSSICARWAISRSTWRGRN